MTTDKVLEARKTHASLRKELNERIFAAGFVWNGASEREIRAVTSLKEAIRAFKRAPRGYPAKEKALKKWVDLCTEPWQVGIARDKTTRSFSDFWLDENCEKYPVGYGIQRLTVLCQEIINSAQTGHDLWKIRYVTPRQCQKSAIEKALQLCTNSDQAREIHCNMGFDCERFRDIISYRATELYEQEKGNSQL